MEQKKTNKIEKEFINLNINKKTNIIKIDETDNYEQDDQYDAPTCGVDEKDDIIKISKLIHLKNKTDKTMCCKCKKNKSNFNIRAEFQCKECFLNQFNHKFRSNLRAHCKIRHEDTVLVHITGLNSSISLIHLIFNTFYGENKSNRKMFFKIQLVYVEDSIVYFDGEGYKNRREENIKLIEDLCKGYNLPITCLMLENLFEIYKNGEEIEKIKSSELGATNNDNINKMRSLLKLISTSGPDFTADLVNIVKNNYILHYGYKNKFTKIMTPTTSQTFAANIFNKVAKGRGVNMKEELGYIDDHYLNGKIKVLHPMKDFLANEILTYNHIYSLPLIELYSGMNHLLYNTAKASFNNTNYIINNFFNALQGKIGSTINTVVGTSERLKKEKNIEKMICCRVCLGFIDEVYNKMEIGSIDTMDKEEIFKDNTKNMCFGCKRMFQNSNADEILKILPNFLKYDN